MQTVFEWMVARAQVSTIFLHIHLCSWWTHSKLCTAVACKRLNKIIVRTCALCNRDGIRDFIFTYIVFRRGGHVNGRLSDRIYEMIEAIYLCCSHYRFISKWSNHEIHAYTCVRACYCRFSWFVSWRIFFFFCQMCARWTTNAQMSTQSNGHCRDCAQETATIITTKYNFWLKIYQKLWKNFVQQSFTAHHTRRRTLSAVWLCQRINKIRVTWILRQQKKNWSVFFFIFIDKKSFPFHFPFFPFIVG